MSSLYIVSNRLPIKIISRKNKFYIQPTVGGLATGLKAFYEKHQCRWVGWPGTSTEKLNIEKIESLLCKTHYYPVFLSQTEIENYYYGFCNRTLWPLFHYFTQYTTYDEKMWNTYRNVNEIYAKKILSLVKKDDIVWIHDYQLLLLPKLLRDKKPRLTIGFFLHIPFPSFEIFRLLPWRNELLDGILGADLIGFHTYEYVQHFLDSIRLLFGYEHNFGEVIVNNRLVKIDSFPMGIDYEHFAESVEDKKVKTQITKIREKSGKCKIIFSIDRLDYTKGILQRLNGLDLFFEKYPTYRGKVMMILVVVPSRTGVKHYIDMKRQIDETIGKINGKYSTIGYTPILYLYRTLPFHHLVALYNIADVALITPLRDGMNLIAKEFVTTKNDGHGVLILSEMAGAAKELTEALIINPNNPREIADAIKRALSMTEKEQINRNRIMQRRLKQYDVMYWATDFIERLSYVKKNQKKYLARKLTAKLQKDLIEKYRKSNKRIIFLDYDGTLVPFTNIPNNAEPDKILMDTLRTLIREKRNEVVIISGRDKQTLKNWFSGMPIGIIAEHGVWIKRKQGRWKLIANIRNDWMDDVRPILERYVNRTPGSFIEEKDYSLVWHYRNVDRELGIARASELKNALVHLTANLDIGVIVGNKVIEIKNVGINKGKAVTQYLSKLDGIDFILMMGDDITDEDVFMVLSEENTYTIKIGYAPSRAKYYVNKVSDARNLLRLLGGSK